MNDELKYKIYNDIRARKIGSNIDFLYIFGFGIMGYVFQLYDMHILAFTSWLFFALSIGSFFFTGLCFTQIKRNIIEEYHTVVKALNKKS